MCVSVTHFMTYQKTWHRTETTVPSRLLRAIGAGAVGVAKRGARRERLVCERLGWRPHEAGGWRGRGRGAVRCCRGPRRRRPGRRTPSLVVLNIWERCCGVPRGREEG